MIPKKLRWRGADRLMSIFEMVEIGAVSFDNSELYEQHDIEVVDNSPEEIAAAALELDDRLTETWKTEQDDEHLQEMFWAALRANPYGGRARPRIGAAFLRGNPTLLTRPNHQAQ